MGHELASVPDGGLVVRQQHIDNRVVVTLTGSLDLDGVEELAACADRICRGTVRAATFDVSGVAAADDAGVRTLAAACACLSSHRVVAEVRGVGGQFRQVLGRLGLTLPEAPPRPARLAAGRPAGAAARPAIAG